jgi:hypothetical protein
MTRLFKKSRLKFRMGIVVTLLLAFNFGCGQAPGADATGAPPPGNVGTGAQVLLSWDAPSTNGDGTPLTDLARYRVYIGQTSPLDTNSAASVTVEDATEYTFSDLPPGVYHFAVTAVNFAGAESGLSNEVTKIVL